MKTKTWMRGCVAVVLGGILALSACNNDYSVLSEQEQEDEDGNENVLLYHAAKATQKPVNIVIVGNGFTAADMEQGGRWETAGRAMGKAFVEAPVIRDYKDFFNVYVLFTPSQADSYAADKLNGTPFKPNGGNSPHPDRSLIHAAIKAAVPGIDSQGGMGDGYFVICINNLKDCQWDWYSGVATGDCRAIGKEEDIKQFVYHELIGHGIAGLDEEYAGSGSKTWGGGTPNTSGHGFPAYGSGNGSGKDDAFKLTAYSLSAMPWPDDSPNGPMSWADGIFGDKKGDGFLALPQKIIDEYHLEKYFINNPRVKGKTFDYDPFTDGVQSNQVWLSPFEDKSSAWTATNAPGTLDWRLWPGWVAFIGRTGYTYTTYQSYLRPAPWINRLGGGSATYQAEDACTMRQTSAHFCVICRYRMWVKMQEEFNADGYGKPASDYWMSFPDGKYGGKFPSEFGLKRFVGASYYNDRKKNMPLGK